MLEFGRLLAVEVSVIVPVSAKALQELRAQVMASLHGFMDQRGYRELGAGEGDLSLVASMIRPDPGLRYQLGLVQDGGEPGRKRASEFTRLRWCRAGQSKEAAIAEVADLLASIFRADFPILVLTYRDAFLRRLDIDPFQLEAAGLKAEADALGLRPRLGEDVAAWMALLFSHFIEPTLGFDGPVFLTDLPATQAVGALVGADEAGVPVAARFDLYVDGLRLARGLVPDQLHGSSMVSLGVDHLLMILLDEVRIVNVIPQA